MVLCGCVSKNGKEVDGLEFEIRYLEELIKILQEHKSVHLNYFNTEGGDLDLWIRVEE